MGLNKTIVTSGQNLILNEPDSDGDILMEVQGSEETGYFYLTPQNQKDIMEHFQTHLKQKLS